MSETVSSPNINQEITRLRSLLSTQLKDAQQRLSAAQAGLSAAQSELESAAAAATTAEKQFNDYNVLFQTPAAAKGAKSGPVAKSVASATPGKPAAAVQSKPKVQLGRPPKQTGGGTVPERLASVMGKRIWTAAELEEGLIAAGIHLQSNNVKSYISTTLNSSLKNARGPDGELKGSDGKPIKVHVFYAVERGHYRVSTAEDIQNEVAKILAAQAGDGDEETPADAVFAQRGIDVRGAMAANH